MIIFKTLLFLKKSFRPYNIPWGSIILGGSIYIFTWPEAIDRYCYYNVSNKKI
jgi:hypothetical protein